MRNPVRSLDAQWRVRIGFILAGAIFMLSQFVAATPPIRDDAKGFRTADTVPLDSTNETDAD